VPFKVKKTTLFDKLFKAYCQKKALDQSTLVFMDAEGKRVLPHQTPAEVCSWTAKILMILPDLQKCRCTPGSAG